MRDKENSIPLHIFKDLYQKGKEKEKKETKQQTPLNPFNAINIHGKKSPCSTMTSSL